MSQIPDEKLLHKLSDAVSQMVPDRAEELWEQPVTEADGSEWFLDSTAAKRPKVAKKRYFISAVAACLVLCIVSAFLFPLMPSASVYLDVNPSVMLKVNYRNRVTEVSACNVDGEKILGDMDFSGADLDVALYAILGSMVHHGYLTESKDTILVSVQCANATRAKKLKTEVSSVVSDSLQNMINAGEVLSHQVEADDVHEEDDDTDFTPGKAAFIKELTEKYPQLEEEDLDDLTMDEIVSLLEKEDLDYSDYKDDVDDADDDDVDDVDADDVGEDDGEDDEEQDNDDDD